MSVLRAAVLCVAFVSAGCGGFRVTFHAYSPRGPSGDRAVWAYPADVRPIVLNGGQYLGTLQASGRLSSGDMIERMVVEAGAVGGTHIVEVDASTHEQVVQSGAAGAGPLIRNWRLPTYDVFYVPRERWRDLPPPLQPL